MEDLTNSYREWILSQHIEGCTIEQISPEKISLKSEQAVGEINFYDLNGTIVVELRLERTQDGESCFFLHFEPA